VVCTLEEIEGAYIKKEDLMRVASYLSYDWDSIGSYFFVTILRTSLMTSTVTKPDIDIGVIHIQSSTPI
jgi:hypothetical protein